MNFITPSYSINAIFLMNIIQRIFQRRGNNKPNPNFKETKEMLAVKEVKQLQKLNQLKPVTYHFVIGSSKFLLKNEPLEEMLRERAQFFKKEGKPITFWLVKSPEFLNSNQLSEIQNKLLKAGLSDVELTAIVSVDESFITWLKLRLQNVGQGSFIALTGDILSPLSSKLSA